MLFKIHSEYRGRHSFLSASKYHWIRYDDEKLERTFLRTIAAARGTQLHALAADAIKMRVKLQGRTTLARYVNDAIGYRMTPELVLFYSPNCFGTADALSYRQNKLRIHDLKTGDSSASMDQLLVYTAIFCLEYGFKPHQIEIELRLYQNEEIQIYEPTVDEIVHIMDKIVMFDQRIEQLKAELDD